ncbi:MAG: MOSC domain-containing protein [Pseudomonadota bacterium]
MKAMAELLVQFPRDGRVEWIGIRPARREPLRAVETVEITETGLAGDHRSKPGKRAVTLIQAEHLPVIERLCGLEEVDPATLRRNILVSDINLMALKGREFDIGSATLRGVDPCAPCSRMEELLGPGGYNAMRGHGGITAEVLTPGTVCVGDAISAIKPD